MAKTRKKLKQGAVIWLPMYEKRPLAKVKAEEGAVLLDTAREMGFIKDDAPKDWAEKVLQAEDQWTPTFAISDDDVWEGLEVGIYLMKHTTRSRWEATMAAIHSGMVSRAKEKGIEDLNMDEIAMKQAEEHSTEILKSILGFRIDPKSEQTDHLEDYDGIEGEDAQDFALSLGAMMRSRLQARCMEVQALTWAQRFLVAHPGKLGPPGTADA